MEANRYLALQRAQECNKQGADHQAVAPVGYR